MDKIFHACFRAPDIAGHHAPLLYSCHTSGIATPDAVSEAVEILDHYAARFVNKEAVGGFNELSFVLAQGESADLLIRAKDKEKIAAHRGIYQ